MVAVISSIGWVDDTDTVEVRSNTVDLMSYIKWCDILKSVCYVICSACDVIHTLGLL